MFSNLNPDELEIVLGAMQEVKKSAGDEVIRQGDDGDDLYVVETGHLRCTKVFVSNKVTFSSSLILKGSKLIFNLPVCSNLELNL